jgi:hypothetical protein
VTAPSQLEHSSLTLWHWQAEGTTPLVMASINGHAAVIRVLLARGAVTDRGMVSTSYSSHGGLQWHWQT